MPVVKFIGCLDLEQARVTPKYLIYGQTLTNELDIQNHYQHSSIMTPQTSRHHDEYILSQAPLPKVLMNSYQDHPGLFKDVPLSLLT